MSEHVLPNLIGHEAAQKTLRTMIESGKMPHAILLTGPEGVGKRLFAEHLARCLLCGFAPLGAPDLLEADDGHPRYAQIDAGAHPDFFTLEPAEDSKTKTIKVDDTRALLQNVGLSGEEARVIIVDAAEYMNVASANAILKNLEEPGTKTYWVLISHAPSKLLPTIISRCRTVRVSPLSDDDTAKVLAKDYDDAAVQTLLPLVQGVPGVASMFAGKSEDISALLDGFFNNCAPNAKGKSDAYALSDKIGQKRVLPLAIDILLVKLATEVRSASKSTGAWGVSSYALSHLYDVYLWRKRRMEEVNISPALTFDAMLEDFISAKSGVLPRKPMR
ncbi:MAG: DNA polymerase III subunit [Pseudomonadota bacterium]|nr:DNA polymerase III subunit [Pseudomonadota bacterium]